MRISDWSSDVCSSDLRALGGCPRIALRRHHHGQRRLVPPFRFDLAKPAGAGGVDQFHKVAFQPHHQHRSEEHTSELQSLMRISYAVFCLNKKKTRHTYHSNSIHTELLTTSPRYD